MWNIFEQPWTLLGIAILLSFVVAITRLFLQNKRHTFIYAGFTLSIFLAFAAFAIDILVKTDLEKIKNVIQVCVKAVEEENCDAIEKILSEQYSDSRHKSKTMIMAHCKVALADPLVEKNIKKIFSIEISPPNATAIFTVRILFDKQGMAYQNFVRLMLVKAQVNLQKENDNWLINRTEILEINQQPMSWKKFQY
jgi:hypothetical protein